MHLDKTQKRTKRCLKLAVEMAPNRGIFSHKQIGIANQN